MTWRPIWTAPKDGRPIEIAWIVNPPTVEAVKRSRWLSARGGCGFWAGNWTPTHWRPLRAGSTSTAAQSQDGRASVEATAVTVASESADDAREGAK